MYVAGNLCLSTNVALAQSTVIVRGNLDVSNNAAVGASTSLATRVETYVGGNCRYSGRLLGHLHGQPGRESHLQQALRRHDHG